MTTLSSQDAVAALTATVAAIDVSSGSLGPYSAAAAAAKASVLAALAIATNALAGYSGQLPALAGDAIGRGAAAGAVRASQLVQELRIAEDQLASVAVSEGADATRMFFDFNVRTVLGRGTFFASYVTSAAAMSGLAAAILAGGGTGPQTTAALAAQTALTAATRTIASGPLDAADARDAFAAAWLGGLTATDFTRYRAASGT